MKNTKEKILQYSRILFNELGYSQVTVRMIALKLNMSSGNLNYHFKKREDILEALYFEMVSEFDRRVEGIESQVFSLRKIKSDISTSMIRMFKYKFFWTDLHNLLSLNSNIKAHFESAFEKRVKGYQYLFDKLIEIDILNNFEFEKERLFLIERMIVFSNTFMYASSLYTRKDTTQDYFDEQSNILLSMLYPYLKDLGKNEFKTLIPNYFE